MSVAVDPVGDVADRRFADGRRAFARELEEMLWPERFPPGHPRHDADHVYWYGECERETAFQWSADTTQWVADAVATVLDDEEAFVPVTDPKELVHGLMRGNRREMRLGYDGPNAALAVCELLGVPAGDEARRITAYAFGFASGLHGDIAPSFIGPDHELNEAVREGFEAGEREDPLLTYPAPFPAGAPLQ